MAATSDIRNVEIHRLRNTHDPLLAIVVAEPVAMPAPGSRRLGRRQRDRVAPGIRGFQFPVRIGGVKNAVCLVELVGVRVEMAIVRPFDFVELAICPASAGRVVGALADAVAV